MARKEYKVRSWKVDGTESRVIDLQVDDLFVSVVISKYGKSVHTHAVNAENRDIEQSVKYPNSINVSYGYPSKWRSEQ